MEVETGALTVNAPESMRMLPLVVTVTPPPLPTVVMVSGMVLALARKMPPVWVVAARLLHGRFAAETKQIMQF